MISRVRERAKRSIAFRTATIAEDLSISILRDEMAAAGLGNVDKIHTFTRPDELRALYTLASRLPEQSTVIEIGSYLGASTCYLAFGVKRNRGRVVCLDTWQNETMPGGERDTFQEFQSNIAPVLSLVTCVRKRSDEVLSSDLPADCALAFIDGDHSYEAVCGDVHLIGPTIANGGTIAFHDAATFSGVSKAIGELLASGEWTVDGKVGDLLWIKRNRHLK